MQHLAEYFSVSASWSGSPPKSNQLLLVTHTAAPKRISLKFADILSYPADRHKKAQNITRLADATAQLDHAWCVKWAFIYNNNNNNICYLLSFSDSTLSCSTTVLRRQTTWADGHSSVYSFLINFFFALGIGDALGTKIIIIIKHINTKEEIAHNLSVSLQANSEKLLTNFD